MQTQMIESSLKSLVEEIVLTPVDTETLLMESGIVDSLSAVDIVLAVQQKYGVRIPATEINEHLRSIKSLAQFLAQHEPD